MARQLSDKEFLFPKKVTETTADRRRRQAQQAGEIKPPVPRVERAALYLRVSSEKSVESNLSIPDQQAQLEAFCEDKGWIVSAIYVEPGVSAKSTARREFQRMMYDAQAEVKPFDKILVHNTSRFARSSFDYDSCERLLHQLDIELLAVSQTFANDIGGWMAKRMTTVFDEFHSRRSGVDSMRARRRLVKEGHWPGSTPPYGYKLIPASDNARRRVLALEASESRLVEMIFSFARCGDGTSAPMGILAITKWINDHRFRTRNGSCWGIQAIHRMLTNSVYYGVYYWGVNTQKQEFNAMEDPLPLPAPAIVTREEFDAVQQTLEARDPKMGSPRAMGSRLLLSGIAKCKCGAAMTLGTGTGKLHVVYEYYVCSSTNRGQQKCTGPRIPTKQLDAIVRDVIRNSILQDGRLSEMLVTLQQRETLRRKDATGTVKELREKLSAAESALRGLLEAAKTAPLINTQPVFQSELISVTNELNTTRTLLSETLSADADFSEITPERIANFRLAMEDVIFGDNEALAKIYIGTIIERVVVGERFIIICGHDEDLRRAIIDTIPNDPSGGPGVRRYVRRWRKRCPLFRHSYRTYGTSKGGYSLKINKNSKCSEWI